MLQKATNTASTYVELYDTKEHRAPTPKDTAAAASVALLNKKSETGGDEAFAADNHKLMQSTTDATDGVAITEPSEDD
ncbi:hypothetical protein NDU88_002514 [Pleurodeles waltl]|uniref:Uncharacterized protein n=1 Tax=Pleurodeles waltl TaxID=8319 RepID=A0AAV7WNQ1_PLEWA|nr:hypothetical protein NDU88_002514 [Pleurodeles waltl]